MKAFVGTIEVYKNDMTTQVTLSGSGTSRTMTLVERYFVSLLLLMRLKILKSNGFCK